MNLELKSLLKILFDTYKALADGVSKKDTAILMSDLYAVASDVPSLMAHISDLQLELTSLTGSANKSDLIAFVLSEFKTVSSDTKAQAILSASLNLISNLISDGLVLATALKG